LNSLLSEDSASKVSLTILKELDVWSLRWKLSEIYSAKFLSCNQFHANDIICTHFYNKDSRTCTPYFCSYGYISQNDKLIMRLAFVTFIFLTKLKDQWPDHASITDFGETNELVKKQINKPQIVPVSNRTGDYSIKEEYDAKYIDCEEELYITELLKGITKKGFVTSSEMNSKMRDIIISKLKVQEQAEREPKKEEIKLAEIYYANNVKSVEIA